ncbi:hypothetical protein RN04_03385 [Arthrobacter sp. W1]|nr:hypothetical protein RN04_03385 [Arthrobacter sp. W1]
MDKCLGDVLTGWPEFLELIAIKRGQPVQDNLFYNVEFLSHLCWTSGPTGDATQILVRNKKPRNFQPELPLDSRRLACCVASDQMEDFMCEYTTLLS